MRPMGASEESGGGRGPRCLLLPFWWPLAGWYLAGLILTAAVLVATLAATAASQTPRAQTMRTERMRLVYLSENHGYIVPHLSRCFENSLRFHGELFDYEPDGDVTVILQDADDHGYAGTTAMPRNYLTLGIEPFEHVYGTCPTNERMNWVMNHELVHLVASDQATRGDRRWRWLFQGKVTPTAEDPLSIFYSYLTNPRRYAPRWYHEGVAVFLETWMAGGIGRAQNGYDEMVFRTMVRDSVDFYDIVGIESEGTASDFQTGQLSYLYGTRFVCYLALMYGPEKVIEWVQRTDGSKAYFSARRQQGLLLGPVPPGLRRLPGRRVAPLGGVGARLATGEPRGPAPVSDHGLPGPLRVSARLGLAGPSRSEHRRADRRRPLSRRVRAHPGARSGERREPQDL